MKKSTHSVPLWNKFIEDTKTNPNNYGKYVHLAVKRFENDLEQSKKVRYPFKFDEIKAQKSIDFIQLLRQTKGDFYNEPIKVLPWQAFVLANVFGWVKKKSNTRRFSTAVIEVGRKNGKTVLLSGILLILMLSEKGANLFCGANAREQAKILFSQVGETVKLTAGLSKLLKVQTYSINNPKTFSYLKAVSSETNNLDGLNVSGAVVDEIATAKNPRLWNVLRGGMASRKEPILFGISSASDNKSSFGFKQRQYTKKILDGEHLDDSYFGLVFEIDENDDPTDKSTWIKANPSLGLTFQIDDLENQFNSSVLDTVDMNDFITKRLNRYTVETTTWIAETYWKQCLTDRPKLKDKEPVVIAYDLARTKDFNAVSFTYPERNFYTEFKFFIPKKNIAKRIEFENKKYKEWIDEGYIQLVGDEQADYEAITNAILQKIKDENLDVKRIVCDPNLAEYINRKLEKAGYPVLIVPQYVRHLDPPTKITARAVELNEISLENNPVFLWMCQNAQVETFPDGKIKVKKGTDRNKKIDGVIALILGFYYARKWVEENEDAKHIPVKKASIRIFN